EPLDPGLSLLLCRCPSGYRLLATDYRLLHFAYLIAGAESEKIGRYLMPAFGSFALLLALALSGYSLLAGIFGLRRHDPMGLRLAETARRAGIATFIAVAAAAATLLWAAFHDDFSVAYILHHSNRDLPAPYKFAVLWSGQEGSLLFWALLLSAYGLVLRLRYKTDVRLFASASVVIAAVQVFFLLLLVLAARPFAVMQGPMPPD